MLTAMPSPRIRDATRSGDQPTVLSSASSPWRSMIDIAIVLATLIAPTISAITTITRIALEISVPLAPARRACWGSVITCVPGKLRSIAASGVGGPRSRRELHDHVGLLAGATGQRSSLGEPEHRP